MKQPTQNELVLRHLIRYGSITDTRARDSYGIARLAARVHDLRHTYGANIYSFDVKFRTRLGRAGMYAQYNMMKLERETWRERFKGGK